MFEKINEILAQWDPIGVGNTISESEYTQYVLPIMSLKEDKIGLENYLKKILDHIGLSYNPNGELLKKISSN